jgi:hypothetical protein
MSNGLKRPCIVFGPTRGWLTFWIGMRTQRYESPLLHRKSQDCKSPRFWLDRYMNLISKMVPLACCELIYSIDEAGLSNWQDRRPKKVLLSAESFEKATLWFGPRCETSDINLHDICGRGGHCPLLVSSDCRTSEVCSTGIWEKGDLWIGAKKSPYIDQALFEAYIELKLILHIKNDRQGVRPQDRPGLLFYENCGTHCMPRVLRHFAQQWILVNSCPHHTSGIFKYWIG